MLQHNSASAGKRAHVAHAAVMGLHAMCCGVPALAMLAAGLSGAATSATFASGFIGYFHNFLHRHEVWILVLSAALVVTGGWFEAASRRHGPRGFPWLFAFSVLCFLINVAIIAAHRA